MDSETASNFRDGTEYHGALGALALLHAETDDRSRSSPQPSPRSNRVAKAISCSATPEGDAALPHAVALGTGARISRTDRTGKAPPAPANSRGSRGHAEAAGRRPPRPPSRPQRSALHSPPGAHSPSCAARPAPTPAATAAVAVAAARLKANGGREKERSVSPELRADPPCSVLPCPALPCPRHLHGGTGRLSPRPVAAALPPPPSRPAPHSGTARRRRRSRTRGRRG